MTASRAFALVLSALLASATAPADAFSLRGEARPGSAVRTAIAVSARIPLDKRYEELTAEQRAVLNAAYESVGPDDEPPFPAAGLEPLVRLLHQAQQKLRARGGLFLVATVAADGSVSEVKVIGSPGAEMARVAGSVLMLTRFKPARCAGEPCSMQYPFALNFEMR